MRIAAHALEDQPLELLLERDEPLCSIAELRKLDKLDLRWVATPEAPWLAELEARGVLVYG